ncbi:AraC family transcriptional regulator [Dysgonomonas sp. ZJ279]|uniref:AraC family transcriptional regulator n=1 Tax=Dysgonomonas sp. ZJ279 TaxID=2709796 RepID=UPI0013ED8853|nr:helix-turn-helix transcriptional regulator [Dysgonomonas sp. ZJ279]
MKQNQQQIIPVRRMDAQTPLGIEFSHREIEEHDEMAGEVHVNIIHRDDYYMFLFLEMAEGMLTIDFEEIKLTENTVLYVRPGQVHYAVSKLKTKGWYLSIDSVLVEKNYKNMFEEQFFTQRPITLDASVSVRMSETANLLYTSMQADATLFSNGIILGLANIFIGIIAEQYINHKGILLQHKSRSAQIAHQFKEVLSENYKAIKRPIEYAKILNYSLSHLNESVKGITGFSVSYWVHQQIVLEAKRLLYFTDMDVKEVAFSLGYEDHTYFSRLFSKVVGVPPSKFRRKFHE